MPQSGKWILLVLCLSCLGGCVTREVTIHLNPDGSGRVAFIEHYDRADAATRRKLQKHFSSPRVSFDLEQAKLRKIFARPHFQITTYKRDLKELRTAFTITFRDINLLLAEKQAKLLGLKRMDFSVDGEALSFTMPEDKDLPPLPIGRAAPPPQRTIRIINTKTKQEIRCFHEMKPETAIPAWTGKLTCPGHRIKRKPITYIYEDLPVITINDTVVRTAAWHISDFSPGLKIKLQAPLPTEGKYHYIGWIEAMLKSGRFLPASDAVMASTSGDSMKGSFAGGGFDRFPPGHFLYELLLKFPKQRVTRLEDAVVRLKVERASRKKWHPLLLQDKGVIIGGITFSVRAGKDNRLDLDLKGSITRFIQVAQVSTRGNRFALHRNSSSSAGDSAAYRYETLMSLAKGKLEVQLFDDVSECYVDLPLPSLSLIPARTTSAVDWRVTARAELAPWLKTSIPAVNDSIFKDKNAYTTYFSGLADNQLLPAIIEVILFAEGKKVDKANWWLQIIAQAELRKRAAYLKANRQSIADGLFALFRILPETSNSLNTFFVNLELGKLLTRQALAQLKKGNLRFASKSFFSAPLSAEARKGLKGAYSRLDSWNERKDLMELLMTGKQPDVAFARAVASDQNEQQWVRAAAFKQLLTIEQPIPVEILRQGLLTKDTAGDLCRDVSRIVAKRADIARDISPLLPVIRDLAEMKDKQLAEQAGKLLEALGKKQKPK